MPRIRSIHPGIFTDEAFMTATPNGRTLIMGLWCEAFDDGCVELKPVTLKARIFPADNVDIGALLDELETLRVFKRFKAHGKEWGAIRNFRKFQRPKQPNQSGVLTAELADYVGMPRSDKHHPSHATPPADDDLFPEPDNEAPLSGFPQTEKSTPLNAARNAPSAPTISEIAIQMEEGGDKGRRKEEKQHGTAESEPSREAGPSRADDLRSFERDCRGLFPEGDQPKGSFAPMALLVERGAKPDELIVVLRAEAAKHRDMPIASWPGWAVIVGSRLDAPQPRKSGPPKAPPPRFTGRKVNTPRAGALPEDFLRAEHAAGRWTAAFGPAPGLPGCVLPN